jgi:acetyl-CoA carboxylase carboxyl transferase subunit beta
MSIIEWFVNKNNQNKKDTSKLDIPGNLWIKCISCNEVLYSKDFEQNMKVCPKCNHHFRLTALERIALTVDNDSFQEVNQNLSPDDSLNFIDLKSYKARIIDANKKTGLNDAIVTGLATINNNPVALGVMDFSYMGGSMGAVVGEKIARIFELATKKAMPAIIMSSSGGARMQEGMNSLMQMAKTSAAIYKHKQNNLLYISVLLDPTTGGTTASFAMLGDLNITEPNALIGFAGARVIEQTIKQKLPKDFQKSEYLQEHGMIDHIVHRKKMKNFLATIIEMTNFYSKKEYN